MKNVVNELRLQVGKQTIIFKRVGLKKWLALDHTWLEVHRAAAERNIDEFVTGIFEYLSAASDEDPEIFEELPWTKISEAVLGSWEVNRPKIQLPMYGDKRLFTDATIPWEYPGRNWYVWANTLAEIYGWTLEYISNLDIDDAAALFQEITINAQIQKEWEWSLTEIAYPYNSSTKKNEFKPLHRPNWMLPKIEQPKIVKIRKDMMPVGNIIDLAALYGAEHDGKS